MNTILEIIAELEKNHRIEREPLFFDVKGVPVFDSPEFGFDEKGEPFWPAEFIANGI